MRKEEQSSRWGIICHIKSVMGIELLEAVQLVNEMEKNGLITFEASGNIGLLVLEGHHEAYHS